MIALPIEGPRSVAPMPKRPQDNLELLLCARAETEHLLTPTPRTLFVKRAGHLNGAGNPTGVSGLPDPGCERPPLLIPALGPTRKVPSVDGIASVLDVCLLSHQVLDFRLVQQHLLVIIHVDIEHVLDVCLLILDGEGFLARVDVIAVMHLLLFFYVGFRACVYV